MLRLHVVWLEIFNYETIYGETNPLFHPLMPRAEKQNVRRFEMLLRFFFFSKVLRDGQMDRLAQEVFVLQVYERSQDLQGFCDVR